MHIDNSLECFVELWLRLERTRRLLWAQNKRFCPRRHLAPLRRPRKRKPQEAEVHQLNNKRSARPTDGSGTSVLSENKEGISF